MRSILFILLLLNFNPHSYAQNDSLPYVLVLGVAQDGGYPHIGCKKECCEPAWNNDSIKRNVVSLALVDPQSSQWWLFEATPDINEQLHLFAQLTLDQYNYLPAGIFITHAHIGHYTGLMELGREAMSSENVPVYVLPKMKQYLETNGPWSQLVSLHNIELFGLTTDEGIQLNERIAVAAIVVPHRDEFSETAGFKMSAGGKKYLFIPDINKWSSFDQNIIELVKACDIAFLDATFYSTVELGDIDIREVPHPFVIETIDLFSGADVSAKNKIHFIHMNHTNPLLRNTLEKKEVMNAGFKVAEQGVVY